MEIGLWAFLTISSTAWAAVAIFKIKGEKKCKCERKCKCECDCKCDKNKNK